VPLGLKVFLTALAIVDDIAAVLVIAFFYTPEVEWVGLLVGGLCVAALIGANRMGVRHPIPYALLGILLWMAVLKSGIHATIAGVVAAMTIPARTVLDAPQFLQRGRRILEYFERSANRGQGVMTDVEQQIAINALEDTCEKAQPPLYRLEKALHPWVSFAIMPIFALANAGVSFSGGLVQTLLDPIAMGVVAGLLLGKPLGIGLASWLAVKAGFASLPARVNWHQIHGAAWLAGIGFTMSLFIAGLAFSDASMLSTSKIGVLAASVLAATIGCFLLWNFSGKSKG
jgi:NhaA family Na+:H+ antiporter